ncbi:MAG: porin, partial [Azospira sp.]|nr:porin [Azospira sp.]
MKYITRKSAATAALAVAATLPSLASAQSNVTVYGVVDAGYAYASSDRSAGSSANFNGINAGLLGGSRIGFRGEENLGDGLKALFVLEYGSLGVDTNTGITGSRQSWVGLRDAKLGTVALGRQYAPGYAASGRNNAFGGSTRQSPLNRLTSTGGNSITGDEQARVNNSISYASPKWGGFSVNAIYGFGENNGGNNGVSSGGDGLFGAGLNYANGPLNLDFVFQQRRGYTGTSNAVTGIGNRVRTTASGDDVNEWAILGSYDLKLVKLFASYQVQDDKNGTSGTEGGNKVWAVSASVPVSGNGSV